MLIAYTNDEELYFCEADKEKEMLEIWFLSNNRLDLTKGYKRIEIPSGQACFNVCGENQLWSN